MVPSKQHKRVISLEIDSRKIRDGSVEPTASTTPQRYQLTRDDRLQIQVLRTYAGLTYEQIAQRTGFTIRQVQSACQANHPTPQKRKGRSLFLKSEEIDRLIEYVTRSRYTRRLSYSELALHLNLNCSKLAIKSALNSRGYFRYLACRKPPLSQINKTKRLTWAEEHINWTLNQWKTILWTDESWVLKGRHTRTWVTRKKDEVFEDTCIVERRVRSKGWMDGAPGHGAQATQKRIREHGINMIHWPPFSPDLNPIEMGWNWMKDFIQANFPDNLNANDLRIALKEAWEALPESFLEELIESMPERCKAIIEAKGGYTRY
ncbi:transposable element tc3 transposase, putative [Talaromyces stipitatus ATCC 10500]|uniref:Transposable element tc3 transposase, putative n=1 Tax=Talaromyces stipitatus (strain ATCC 10500 / CBS 375.48 / QM 6759 / NRRL 1006) TaxID=441959 RepID=B8MAM1_TALSN|nr:transposable element tc3 transposase, putative [Talaromyces stipitatus ATCC 10500]EED17445.1 transposable element tc3 transposase, putative [Talaromyces stipitatus ATCC 10500]